jgi:hypothetical protein
LFIFFTKNRKIKTKKEKMSKTDYEKLVEACYKIDEDEIEKLEVIVSKAERCSNACEKITAFFSVLFFGFLVILFIYITKTQEINYNHARVESCIKTEGASEVHVSDKFLDSCLKLGFLDDYRSCYEYTMSIKKIKCLEYQNITMFGSLEI